MTNLENNLNNLKDTLENLGEASYLKLFKKLLTNWKQLMINYKDDEEFLAEYAHYLKDYSGRETPLYYAETLTNHLGGAKIYLKREDLNHLGAHNLTTLLGKFYLQNVWVKRKLSLKLEQVSTV